MLEIPSSESHTTCHETGCGSMYVTIDTMNGKPFQVFIQNTDCGCPSALNLIARFISKQLQNGVSIEDIAHLLKKPNCEECIKIKAEGKSCWDIIAKELSRYIKPVQQVKKLQSPF